METCKNVDYEAFPMLFLGLYLIYYIEEF
uniref:Uncharacterized protein n=1 Tax=Arundo donax TaxID=35708 RepID=A0A0A9AVL0_ARUDO